MQLEKLDIYPKAEAIHMRTFEEIPLEGEFKLSLLIEQELAFFNGSVRVRILDNGSFLKNIICDNPEDPLSYFEETDKIAQHNYGKNAEELKPDIVLEYSGFSCTPFDGGEVIVQDSLEEFENLARQIAEATKVEILMNVYTWPEAIKKTIKPSVKPVKEGKPAEKKSNQRRTTTRKNSQRMKKAQNKRKK